MGVGGVQRWTLKESTSNDNRALNSYGKGKNAFQVPSCFSVKQNSPSPGTTGPLTWAAGKRNQGQRILLLHTFLFFKLEKASKTLSTWETEIITISTDFVKIDWLILLS